MPDKATVVVLSFRTYGDYVLKAPFLYALYLRFPGARVIVVTNSKGGQVYPLIDSRLEVVVLDHDTPTLRIVRELARIPRATHLFVTDTSRTSLALAVPIRAQRKTGWARNVSRLYGEHGFFDWTSPTASLRALAWLVLDERRVRRPEGHYEGYVELELLDAPALGRPLSAFRSAHALRPARRSAVPYIYCATEAGWKARQLSAAQWTAIAAGLAREHPRHRILIHGAPGLAATLAGGDRVVASDSGSVADLFHTVAGADLVIAPDSFALHIASLYDVPVLGYFGPAHPVRFRPTSPRSRTVFHAPECSPCLQRRGDAPCHRGLAQCSSLAATRPDEILACARFLLKTHPVPAAGHRA